MAGSEPWKGVTGINTNEIGGGGWAPVAHACNPTYCGGRDQEDRGLKPIQANSFKDPISKILNTRKVWQSGSSGGAPV
jgi:hypothetical protein